MTKKNWLCRGLILVLCLAICLSTVACSGKKGNESSEPVGTTGSGTMTYSVEVVSETGTPLEEIGVYIYTDSTMSELVWFAKTDAAGKLTFTDIPSDNFVAVLADVPAGYLVEEYYRLTGEQTQIKLSAGLMEGDLSTVTYKLGDLMLDFSVTAPDGTEYKFSDLLEQKKAIILNFWYLECEPCKSEFPHMQEAYEKYSEDVALLVMNPVNQDNDKIEQFRKDNGYTFPMMACDPNWQNAMQITAYPTTVVVDRFGYITLVHRGTIPETETFEAMMKYFSAEDYEHTVFKSLDDLKDAAGVEQVFGTAENPVQMGVQQSFQVTVEPGQEMHYEIYRLTQVYTLSLRNENAYVIYNGKKYTGSISIAVSADDTNSAVKLVFGNTGKESQTYTVNMSTEKGSMGNPYSLTLGDVTVNVPAGKEQGIFYTFYPDMDGVFTLELKSATAGINYDISVTSIRNDIPVQKKLSEDSIENPETGNKMVAVNAYKGGRVDINIGTYDGSGSYPAGTFQLVASLTEGTLDDLAKGTVQYAVNVTDENGNPVSGVKLSMMVAGKAKELSGSKGYYSTYEKAGTYVVTMAVPRGFTAKTTTFKLTEKHPSVSIKLDTIEKVTYTVTVVDSVTGLPIEGADVIFMDSIGENQIDEQKTDVNGMVTLSTSKDTYMVSVIKEGYISGNDVLTPDSKDVAIALVEGSDKNAKEYSVKVVDYFGNSISGMMVNFIQNGIVRNRARVVDGVATAKLSPGTYTIGVAGNYHTPGATLTDTKTEADITVIAGITEDTYTVNGEEVPLLGQGATYVKPEVYSAVNYYTFTPEISGLYQFTILNNKLAVSSVILESYQGSNPQYPQDLTASLNNPEMKELGNYYNDAANTFVVNIREKNLGATYIVGIKQAQDAVIIITRVGDAMTDETDIEPDVYEAVHTFNWKSTFTANTEFTFIDPLTQKAKDINLVLDEDGFYHLNAINGPVLYVTLGKNAPYLSMSDAMAITDENAVYQLIKVIYDENGKAVARLSYNECLTQYVHAMCPNTGVYPLTEDLRMILEFAAENKGWADYDDPNSDYLFRDSTTGERIAGADPDIAWMYAVCYIEK